MHESFIDDPLKMEKAELDIQRTRTLVPGFTVVSRLCGELLREGIAHLSMAKIDVTLVGVAGLR